MILVVVYGRSEGTHTIQSHYSCYDPLAYPLFHPNGEPGWHDDIMRAKASTSQTPFMEEDHNYNSLGT